LIPFRWARPILLFAIVTLLCGMTLSAFGALQDNSIPLGGSGTSIPRWLVISLNLASVGCFVLWWSWPRFTRRIRPTETAAESFALVPVDAETGDETLWKARALAAEARAAKATALLKSRMMPQLARWMMGELLQKLMHQRSDLLTSQQQAEQEVEELEQRLEKLHAPLEERLRAYERRIAELERDLAAKGDENRELIKAKIDTARKRLQSKRDKTPVGWN